MRKAIIVSITALALMVSINASAKEVTGLGVGGDRTIGGSTGVAIWYFTNHIGVQLVIGADINSPKKPEGIDKSVSDTDFWVALRASYDIARADDVNFYVFLGFNYLMDMVSECAGDTECAGLIGSPVAKDGSAIVIELGVGAMYWFGDHFAIHGEVGVPIILVGEDGYAREGLGEGTYVRIFSNQYDDFLAGSFGFVFKF